MAEPLDRDLGPIGKFEKQSQSLDRLTESMILTMRNCYPEDVVGSISLLASVESDNMTGQLFMVDGGIIMQIRSSRHDHLRAVKQLAFSSAANRIPIRKNPHRWQ